jgi:Diacylglycerol acyltransferase
MMATSNLVGALGLMILPPVVWALVDSSPRYDGRRWRAFQHMEFWKSIAHYFNGKVSVEQKLDDDKQYIFCSFPHGACTISYHDLGRDKIRNSQPPLLPRICKIQAH